MGSRVEVIDDHEVKTDGRTVWITAPNGNTIARFSPLGIDIHTLDADGCLDCRPGPAGQEAWVDFVIGMYRFHDLVIPDRFQPEGLT